jgi:bacterioferritin-associated ferredoxin
VSVELLIAALFGDVRRLFFVRILAVLNALAPCPLDGVLMDEVHLGAQHACVEQHHRAAAVIAIVALEDDDPEDAAARLEGAGGHETGFRTRVQQHGPAVSWWQLEIRDHDERARYLADDFLAARRALEIARTCGGSMVGYACGHCRERARRVIETAAQLRKCIESARRGGAWACKAWRSPHAPPKTQKPRHQGKGNRS